MPLSDVLLLLLAGFAAGGMNALAGGGPIQAGRAAQELMKMPIRLLFALVC